MSYRSFEQLSPSAGSHPSPTANHPGQRKKNVTQGPLFAASQVLRRHRYLLPLGAISASLALGISAYARGERLLKIPYKIPFASRSSVLKDPELKRIFYCGNAQHMYNSLAIMASPFTSSKPMLVYVYLSHFLRLKKLNVSHFPDFFALAQWNHDFLRHAILSYFQEGT